MMNMWHLVEITWGQYPHVTKKNGGLAITVDSALYSFNVKNMENYIAQNIFYLIIE